MPSRPAKIRRNMPAIGRSIEAARDKAGLSQNEAAARAGFTGTRWRHIVYGRRGKSDVLVHASPETLARMALVVRLTPEDVAMVRPDVARELRSLVSADLSSVATVEFRMPTAERDQATPKLVVSQLVCLLKPLREMSDPDSWQRALHIVAGPAPTAAD